MYNSKLWPGVHKSDVSHMCDTWSVELAARFSFVCTCMCTNANKAGSHMVCRWPTSDLHTLGRVHCYL